MIRLENISTIDFIKSVEKKGKTNKIYEYVYEILVAYDINDFRKLKNFLESKNPDLEYECTREILTDYLLYVTGRMSAANLMGREPEIFTFDNYKDSSIDDKTLSITDKSNDGSVLLYTIPLIHGGRRKNVLKYLSIAEIKELLGHIDYDHFQNTFTRMRAFGEATGQKVVNAINFYEQQVLRQAQETEERGINLFTLNKDVKDEIVAYELKYIAEYLVDNARELVWGELTDTHKKRIMSAALSTKGEYIQQDKRALINAISNYTTLSELEQGVIKKKTLNRFIVR